MLIDELEKLCNEATPGRWVLNDCDDECIMQADKGVPITKDYLPEYWKKEDADFVIAARTYMPKLIAIAKAAITVLKISDEDQFGSIGYHPAMDLRKALADLQNTTNG